ncbi:hypothetical protein SAMN04489859_102162 [Paracoccus alcaliphilus]|uniref:Uncharacterized protein n=1 Tax=Paracoccus alcaliphilus TaxID=34002 RepID=A0A1H8KD89_9RHOB|nr:hypothetical protein [Paracoccus alcaliphilus]WCR17084.1 hypothetical protein JHW40_11870 [Paracoccus alcaliphilus]SEN90486.1 hypothetical protein SAMN04489859_102162 [Paracoccus alcaliphilus]
MHRDQVEQLLNRYTPEQLARAYLKASRELNEALRSAEKLRAEKLFRDKLRSFKEGFGI